MPNLAAYGAWKSPITSDLIISETVGLGQIALDGEDVYWVEMRPSEGGRSVVVRRSPSGVPTDVTPRSFNARTRVHEYGGGDFAVVEGVVYFTNFADQRLYRQEPDAGPRAVTEASARRYADMVIDPRRGRLVCIGEDHARPDREAVNCIISVDLLSSRSPEVLASGCDFYSSPRLSPDGSRLAWLSWNHPQMPWDGTELWVADLESAGKALNPKRVAGGPGISVFQPEWSPDGTLYFICDRNGWWNPSRLRDGAVEHVLEAEAEFGLPQWVFGMSTFAFLSAGEIICAFNRRGMWHLGVIETKTGRLTKIESPFTDISGLRAEAGRVFFIGGSPEKSKAVIQFTPSSGAFEVVRASNKAAVDPKYLSAPRMIEFPTGKESAYAFFYPPRNGDYAAPPGDRPPLLVISHGGPTAAAASSLSLAIQFWTSRGIAVADVNYGGSTGYGRAYRKRLEGQWGVVDVDDCVNCARFLVDRGEVDPGRLAIRGGSAGGFTTLAALTFRNVFKAGASHYGVGDLEALATDTHKFESRYLDGLIGPYPARRDLYLERSPLRHVDRLSCPVIFFQGLEDKIVPPDQAEKMVAALRAKGLPVAYVPFAGEQHGFRRSENIKRALDAELYFYARIFGFEPADPLEPVEIMNL
jgi:dipeptidyl aminopeptidase/acylaminoacyl peptidase